MSTANLGLSFYRNYFDGFWESKRDNKESDEVFFARKHKPIYGFRLNEYSVVTAYRELSQLPGYFTIPLITEYPGLLVGTGYAHEIAAKGATKIGFYFDHTTGLPTIPGSSVKGVLRSAFPRLDLRRIAQKDRTAASLEPLVAYKRAYMREVLLACGLPVDQITDAFIDNVEAEIFEGTDSNNEKIPVTNRFICHDAVVTGIESKRDRDGKTRPANLMGPDFITPHTKETSLIPRHMSEPNPIQLLKVMPGVTFTFTFCAKYAKEKNADGTPKYLLSAEQLEQLCYRLLLDHGAGAKTNVGYGRFRDTRPLTKDVAPASPQNEAATAIVSPTTTVSPRQAATSGYTPPEPAELRQLKRGRKFPARILSVENRQLTVKLHVADWDHPLSFGYFFPDVPKVGDWGEVIIKQVNGRPPNVREIILETNKFIPLF
ncbi:CRISPR-associated protein Cmr6 [Lewinella aquimaris]|uniref:CRISPR-associated protein Cmr6 n=1 Tax=Neolewinella aquimaris TaxID=1835722 RepID=A0A840E9B5_9BACT|nr:type III-B CRISPR module RAMP protein Cmr6 [Neolewinella aquimaris]MBB4080312.1 CRISPR-associated protein Cmr6 [Neolewinella aquimaris]